MEYIDNMELEEEVFAEKAREKARVKHDRDIQHAKKKKAIADRYGIEVRGGLHKFVDGNLSTCNRKGNSRKRVASNKKYYDSLNEERINSASQYEDYEDEEELLY